VSLQNVVIIATGLLLGSFAQGFGQTTDSAKAEPRQYKAQTLCPVMKNPIDSAAYTDIQGQRIYHCCRGCEKKLRANPDKYFEEAAKDGVVFQNIQKSCPVTGKGIDKKYQTYYKGRQLYFCSADCIAKFATDPSSYLKKLDESPKADTKVSAHGSSHSH